LARPTGVGRARPRRGVLLEKTPARGLGGLPKFIDEEGGESRQRLGPSEDDARSDLHAWPKALADQSWKQRRMDPRIDKGDARAGIDQEVGVTVWLTATAISSSLPHLRNACSTRWKSGFRELVIRGNPATSSGR
jgi:hypothetical protein